eukprot:361815-Chlamydomonas_euryale.AAC.4
MGCGVSSMQSGAAPAAALSAAAAGTGMRGRGGGSGGGGGGGLPGSQSDVIKSAEHRAEAELDEYISKREGHGKFLAMAAQVGARAAQVGARAAQVGARALD